MALRVGIFVFPDFQILDATGPASVFEIAGRGAPPPYALAFLSLDGGPCRSSSGLEVLTSPAGRAPLDTILFAGGRGVWSLAGDARMQAAVRSLSAGARRTASVCSGAVLLAAAGLLDGRRATTHWGVTRAFASAYPAVRLEPDRIFVRDGDVWTSAGITAGLDLALALVGDDLGEAVARRTARQLVIARRRAGGQSQFAGDADLQAPGGRFTELIDWARAHLDARMGVEALAERAALSPRQFSRAFRAETGVSPARAIERLRLEAARARVEAGSEPIEAISADTGFGDPERMRRAFVRAFGAPPRSVRTAAQRAARG